MNIRDLESVLSENSTTRYAYETPPFFAGYDCGMADILAALVLCGLVKDVTG